VKLIAALGNPGMEYAETRHNIAWLLLEHLAFADELHWQRKFNGHYAAYSTGADKIFFLAPETFMNLSGKSVAEAAQFYKIEVAEILVIHDELELPFGVLGFKQGGGLGGHNGLRSITASLGSRDFKRLRLGISRPAHSDITGYVLRRFNEDEAAVLPTFLEAAAGYLEEAMAGADFDEMVKMHRKERIIPNQS
jgi:PTH1 family peptidyl-tRNA hydrolase